MLKIIDLRVNDRIRPIGISADAYLSWRYESDERNVLQESYEISVKDIESDTVIWESGKVSSRQQAFIGIDTPLTSQREYTAHVKVTDKDHGELVDYLDDTE